MKRIRRFGIVLVVLVITVICISRVVKVPLEEFKNSGQLLKKHTVYMGNGIWCWSIKKIPLLLIGKIN